MSASQYNYKDQPFRTKCQSLSQSENHENHGFEEKYWGKTCFEEDRTLNTFRPKRCQLQKPRLTDKSLVKWWLYRHRPMYYSVSGSLFAQVQNSHWQCIGQKNAFVSWHTASWFGGKVWFVLFKSSHVPLALYNSLVSFSVLLNVTQCPLVSFRVLLDVI